jgi:hypothetical protein
MALSRATQLFFQVRPSPAPGTGEGLIAGGGRLRAPRSESVGGSVCQPPTEFACRGGCGRVALRFPFFPIDLGLAKASVLKLVSTRLVQNEFDTVRTKAQARQAITGNHTRNKGRFS